MKASILVLVSLLSLSNVWPHPQAGDRIRLDSQSDWWSINREVDADENIKTQEREVSDTNLRILGIELGDEMFAKAAAKLGNTARIERGDGAGGRTQACYVSTKSEPKEYFILEQGEVNYAFYLFVNGADWSGRDRCVRSSRITGELATESGVRLGQTPEQLIAVLGRPNIRLDNELVYWLHARKKNSPEDLRKLRAAYPQLSDREFYENYDFYDLGVSVKARFIDSKLTYLAVSKVETN